MDVDTLLKKLAEASEKKRALEREQSDIRRLIETKTRELQAATNREPSWRREQQELIESSQLRARELEKRAMLQRLQEEELQLEVDSLRKRRGTSAQLAALLDAQLGVKSTSTPTNASPGSGSTLSTTTSATTTGSVTTTGSNATSTNSNTQSTSSLPTSASLLDPSQLQTTLNQLLSLAKSLTNNDSGNDTQSDKQNSLVSSGQSSQPTAAANSQTNAQTTGSAKPNAGPYQLQQSQPAGSIPPPAAFRSAAGGIQLVVAKYNYDPTKQSPNEHPELEVPLRVGEYLLVRGEPDEDGFFVGESLAAAQDGTTRRGLVPSNFVARVPDDELPNAIASLMRNAPNSTADSFAALFDSVRAMRQTAPGTGQAASDVLAPPAQFASVLSQNELLLSAALGQAQNAYATSSANANANKFDITSMTSASGSDVTLGVPPPTGIQLERQLSNGVVVCWQGADTFVAQNGASDVLAYHVFVNGHFRHSLKAGDRPRVLIDNVDLARAAYRISVRSVTPRGQSKEAECTLLLGAGATLAPSGVATSRVTATSAKLSWMPSNSNCAHVVLLNGNTATARVCKPGMYKLTLSGLQPDSLQRVVIRARRPGAPLTPGSVFGTPQFQADTDASVDFFTLPGGLPDPPLDVQLSISPLDGLLVVSWLPVSLAGHSAAQLAAQADGGHVIATSNGALVGGYRMYVDGRRIKEIDNPAADRAVLDAELVRFHFANAVSAPQWLTVRTFSTDQRESPDSNAVRIPPGWCAANQLSLSANPNTLPPTVSLTHAAGEYATIHRGALLADPSRLSMAMSSRLGMPMLEHSPTPTPFGYVNAPESPLLSPRSLPGTAWRDHFGLGTVDIDLNGPDPFGPGAAFLSQQLPLQHVRTQTWDGNRSVPPRLSTASAPNPYAAPFGPQVAPPHAPYAAGPGQPFAIAPTGPYAPLASATQYALGSQYGPYGSAKYNVAGLPSRSAHDDLELAARSRHSHNNYRIGRASRSARGSRSSSENRPNLGDSPTTDYGAPLNPAERYDMRPDRFDPAQFDGRDRLYDDRDRLALPRSTSVQRAGPPPNAPSPQPQRMLVALFDYDPTTMSPNPDAAEVELAFREGDLIRMLSGPDADGFFKGEIDGYVGLVPSNMVTELQEEQPVESRRGSGGQSGRRDSSRQPGAPQAVQHNSSQRRPTQSAGPQTASNRPGPRPGQVGQFPTAHSGGQAPHGSMNHSSRQHAAETSQYAPGGPYPNQTSSGAGQYPQPGPPNNQYGTPNQNAGPYGGQQQPAAHLPAPVCPARRRANLAQLLASPIKKAAAENDCNPPAGPLVADAAELAFKNGDLLTLYGEAFEDGCFYAEHATTGKRGWVQAAHVRIYYDATKKQSTAGSRLDGHMMRQEMAGANGQQDMDQAGGRMHHNATLSPTGNRPVQHGGAMDSQPQSQSSRSSQQRGSVQLGAPSASSGHPSRDSSLRDRERNRPANGGAANYDQYDNERDPERSAQKRVQRGPPPNAAEQARVPQSQTARKK